MNSYLIVLAVGIACLVAVAAAPTDTDAELDLSQVASDEKEIKDLHGKKMLYASFCISFRDHILVDIKKSDSHLKQDLFNVVFEKSKIFGSPIGRDSKDLCGKIAEFQSNLDSLYKATKDPISDLYTGGYEAKLKDISCRTVRKVVVAAENCKHSEIAQAGYDKVMNLIKGNQNA